MKTLLALTCAVLLALSGCSSDGDDGEASAPDGAAQGSATPQGTDGGGDEVFEITGDETIQVDEGSSFTLSLEANATTGYRWSERVEGDAVRSAGGEYAAPTEGRVGQGGTQHFDYDAVMAGTSTISLTYAQAGSEDVGQQYTVTVEVS